MAQAVEAAARIGARETYFTHMTHDLPHRATCEGLTTGMTLAHDGLALTVGEVTPEERELLLDIWHVSAWMQDYRPNLDGERTTKTRYFDDSYELEYVYDLPSDRAARRPTLRGRDRCSRTPIPCWVLDQHQEALYPVVRLRSVIRWRAACLAVRLRVGSARAVVTFLVSLRAAQSFPSVIASS